MDKNDIINYLDRIKPYINLSAVCELYNQKNPTDMIDYNNLRVVIKRQSVTRLSVDKLKSFVDFLYFELYGNVFMYEKNYLVFNDEKIEEVVDRSSNELKRALKEELRNGIYK